MILFIAQRPFFGTPQWSTLDTMVSKLEEQRIPQMGYFSTDPDLVLCLYCKSATKVREDRLEAHMRQQRN
jgi:hypothetical protein